MEDKEIALKMIYVIAANKMKHLAKKYKNIEKFMDGDADYDKKLEFAKNNPIDYDEIDKIVDSTEKALNEVGNFDTRSRIIASNKSVYDSYENYLYQKDEVDYLFSHTKRVVECRVKYDTYMELM